ncbi:MAG: hypothetical protein WCA07_15045 [Gloeobacterales cyanobacterium]
MDPTIIPEIGEIVQEYGVEIIEEGPEILEKVGEGLQETVHAIFYPVDTVESVIDYFEGPEPSLPNIEWQDNEETTMRSSSVSYEDSPPPDMH